MLYFSRKEFEMSNRWIKISVFILCLQLAALPAFASIPALKLATFLKRVSSFQNPNKGLEFSRRRKGNDAGRGHKAKRKNYRPNNAENGNNADGGSYVGFPKSNVKRYTKRNKGN